MPPNRRSARLLAKPADALVQADRRFVDLVNGFSPEVPIAVDAVDAFDRMLCVLDAEALSGWFTAARLIGLSDIAVGLISDRDAVRAALEQRPGQRAK